MFEFLCANCGNIGPPSRTWRCAKCDSDAIADYRDPEPVRYREPTGIARVQAEADEFKGWFDREVK